MEVSVGDVLFARLWRWDADRLISDAKTDYADQVNDGVLTPDYSVSVWGMVKAESESVDDLVERLCRHVAGHRSAKWVTFTTGQRLREAGFSWRASGAEHHYDVVLGVQLSVQDVDRLAAVFAAEERRRFPRA